MRNKYPSKKKNEYPKPGQKYKGNKKLTLMGILPTGRRMYYGFLQIYVEK